MKLKLVGNLSNLEDRQRNEIINSAFPNGHNFSNEETITIIKRLADLNIILGPVECLVKDVFDGDACTYYDIMSMIFRKSPRKLAILQEEWGIGTSNDAYERLKA